VLVKGGREKGTTSCPRDSRRPLPWLLLSGLGRGRRERAECERRGLGEGDSWPRPHTFPLPKRRSACRVCAHLGRVRMWASCGWATLQLALASQWIFFCSSEVPCFNTTTTHVLGNRKSRFRKIWLHDFPSLHLPLVQVCTTARTSDRISTKQGTEGGRFTACAPEFPGRRPDCVRARQCMTENQFPLALVHGAPGRGQTSTTRLTSKFGHLAPCPYPQ
jgi:hypothetical protein